jgi:hypothetical protein
MSCWASRVLLWPGALAARIAGWLVFVPPQPRYGLAGFRVPPSAARGTHCNDNGTAMSGHYPGAARTAISLEKF